MALGNHRAQMSDFTRSEHRARVLWSGITFGRNSSATWLADRTLRTESRALSQRVVACMFCCNWGLCATSTWANPTVCSHATVVASVAGRDREREKKKSKQFHVSCKQAIWDTSRKSCEVSCTYSRCWKQCRMKTREDIATSATTYATAMSWKTVKIGMFFAIEQRYALSGTGT